MKAKWIMSTNEAGTNLTYYNLESGISFDCGTTKASSNVSDFIEFAVSEGAIDGDGFYIGNQLICEILLNGELNVKPHSFCN